MILCVIAKGLALTCTGGLTRGGLVNAPRCVNALGGPVNAPRCVIALGRLVNAPQCVVALGRPLGGSLTRLGALSRWEAR